AGPGYDLLTGRGSPVANYVVADLVNVGSTGNLAPPGPQVGSVGVSSQLAPVTYGTQTSATYTVTVNRAATGFFDASLGVTGGLPAGVTWSFTVGSTVTNILHFNPSDTSLTATLTLTWSGHIPAGSFSFTVKATRLDAGGNGTSDQS